MAGQRSAMVEEDLMQNPFLRVLRASYEGLYRRAAERGESSTLLVPCAECLEEDKLGQVFMEAHVLQATKVPGCFTNLLGQGLQIKGASVSSQLGFQESRVCEVLQTESMYDYGNTFRVLVIDKPVIGSWRPAAGSRRAAVPAAGTKASPRSPAKGALAALGGDPADWFNSAPAIQADLFDQVDRFRRTFLQVPGCEQSTAERIREIVGDATKRLVRFHKLTQPSQQQQLDYHVSRNAYAALHGFIFPHLQQILAVAEERLDRAIRSYASTDQLLAGIPGAQGRGLGLVDIQRCSEQLASMDDKITPHEKIACVGEAHSELQRSIAEGMRPNREGGALEITGDDVLSLFIIAVHRSNLRSRLAHVAHVEMYLQGAAGRSGSSEAARFEETGYAVSALQAALQFFLEERRRGLASPGGARSAESLLASYLPAQQGSVGFELDADLDRAGMHLQGLVRQARAVGAQR